MKKYFSGFIALIIFCLIGYHFYTPINFNIIKQVKIAGVTLDVNLATTKDSQEQGLSGRSELKENEGMLFIFSVPAQYSFWMKDMKFNIDMIWIGEDMHVVYIKNNAAPGSYPETYTPNKNAKYVLEVVPGFAQKNNLKVGDTVNFIY